MKKIILSFLRTPFAANLFLGLALRLHGRLYDLISILVVAKHDGIHPKHGIIQYEQWFFNSITADDVVLDIGCNEGGLTKLLGKKARQAYGIEIMEKHFRRAKASLNHGSKVEFFLGDATKFNYEGLHPVSVIVMSNVLEHIKDRVDFLKKTVSSVRWKGKPRLLIRIPTIERDWLPVYKKSVGIGYTLDNTHFIEHTMSEFMEEMKQADMKVISAFVKFGEIYAECSANDGKNQ